MRLYHGCPSPNAVRRAREAAPSHVHGACWTPTKMTPHEWPYFVDNGAFTDSFDESDWLALLDTVPKKMPFMPDFVVLPDEFNNAEKTVAKHREYIEEVLDREMTPAPVLQPGMKIQTQVKMYDALDVDVLFVGGESRWQKANGVEIVETAHDHDLRVHVGNPGGEDEMKWWARVGVDSMDTTTIVQNGYYHWLEGLEGLSDAPVKKGGRQGTLGEVA